MKLIGSDLWFVQRQLWIAKLQPRRNDAYVDAALWCLFGILFTVCLMIGWGE